MIFKKVRTKRLPQGINMANTMLIKSVKNIKEVPQRGCNRFCFLVFAVVSSSPASKQKMDLCSPPWYWKVRRISGIKETESRYPKKMRIFNKPSATALSGAGAQNIAQLVKRVGRYINKKRESASPSTIETPPRIAIPVLPISFSKNRSTLEGFSGSSIPSIETSAEYIRHL